MDKDKFSFPLALEDVLSDAFGREVSDAQLFSHFSAQGVFHTLAEVYMSSHGGVPLAWLNVFPHGAKLQVELSLAVENVEVHYWMEQLGASVALASRGCACYVAFLIDYGEHLFVVVFHIWLSFAVSIDRK